MQTGIPATAYVPTNTESDGAHVSRTVRAVFPFSHGATETPLTSKGEQRRAEQSSSAFPLLSFARQGRTAFNANRDRLGYQLDTGSRHLEWRATAHGDQLKHVAD